MPFSSLARLTRQHVYRLAMPSFLAFSVSLGSTVMPDVASIPGVDQATMAVSTVPFSIARSLTPSARTQQLETVDTRPVYGPQLVTVAQVEPTVSTSESAATIVITPDSAIETKASAEAAEMPVASGTPMQHVTTASVEPTKTLAWGAVVSPAFVAKVHQMCADLGCEPNDVMAAIAFESVETFSPSVRNPMSGATGLIQFMSETAQGLGTSTEELAAMSPEAQLIYVEKYFRPYAGRLSTLSDVYMAILWPRAVGQSEDYPLFPSGSIQYSQNAHLDVDGDGVVTKQEASGLVAAKLRKGQRSEYVLVEAPSTRS